MPVQVHFAGKVLGAGGEILCEQADEFVARLGEQSVIGAALLADGGGALGAHLAAAERAGSVGGEDLGVVGEFEELFVEALVEESG